MSKRLVIVIVNYKTPDLVIGALNSLENEINPSIDQVVIVDNNSSDNSITSLKKSIDKNNWSNWVSLIESVTNGGFSAGNNQAISAYDAKYYLLLNSDAYVLKGAINTLLNEADNNCSLGILGPKIVWPNNEVQVSRFNDMTPLGQFISVAQTGIITRWFNQLGIYEIPIDTNKHGSTQDWLSFACVLIRGKVFNNTGLLDEKYFMYREDNDYCKRARLSNWQLKYVPEASIVHLNQGLSNTIKKRMPNFYYYSRSRYFLKFYGRSGLLLANIAWTLGRVVSFIREVFTRKKTNIHPMTIIDIWKGFLYGKN